MEDVLVGDRYAVEGPEVGTCRDLELGGTSARRGAFSVDKDETPQRRIERIDPVEVRGNDLNG
jgi:hypothetical protein